MRALRAGDLDLAVIFRFEPGDPAGDPGAPFASTRDDVAMAQPLVAAGLAVAFLPSLELARPYPGVAVRELPHAPPGREVWCLRPASRRLPAAQAMVTCLRAAARGLAGVAA